MEVLSEFTLSQSIAWLKNLNTKLIERVELIESIIAKDEVEESDIERLKIIDKNHYTNWEISELPLDYDNLDLCLTIYNSTILEALNKYETFFDYQNNREFESHHYYLSKFISYNIEVDFFIQYFENLSTQLTELSLTFSGCMHESEFGFCFQNTINLANKEPDLQKRKQIYLDAYAAINKYWIENELCFPKETNEYKSQLEHFQEFCFGCQKFIEIIDIQLQNIPLSTKKDFKLIYEKAIPNTSNAIHSEVLVVNSSLSDQNSNNEIKLDQSIIKTKYHKLKENMSNYGFNDLPLIKALTYPKKEELIALMSTSSIDYCIAMFDYLGYINYLKTQYFDTTKEMNTEIAVWLGSNERDIQGQISRLKPSSKEKKPDYKSYLEVENVKNDYNRIKNL